MPLRIPISDAAWSENSFSLDGQNYTFEFYFNDKVDSRWRFNIYLNNVPVIEGVKIVENQLFLSQYDLENFNHGDIGCFRVKSDYSPVGRNNLGIDKSYELLYLTNEEVLEFQESLDND